MNIKNDKGHEISLNNCSDLEVSEIINREENVIELNNFVRHIKSLPLRDAVIKTTSWYKECKNNGLASIAYRKGLFDKSKANVIDCTKMIVEDKLNDIEKMLRVEKGILLEQGRKTKTTSQSNYEYAIKVLNEILDKGEQQ